MARMQAQMQADEQQRMTDLDDARKTMEDISLVSGNPAQSPLCPSGSAPSSVPLKGDLLNLCLRAHTASMFFFSGS